MIDTHAHIYSKEFDEDRSLVLEKALEVGIKKVLMPNINSTSIDFMLQVEEDNPDYCHSMMGLHPCYVKKDFEKELYVVEDWLAKRDFIAIGEIGMDLYWDKEYKKQQEEALKIQLGWAIKHDLPVAIHARNANNEILSIIEQGSFDGLRGVFHCFSGTVEEGQRIKEAGLYLGIGGVVTFKNSGLDVVLKELGPDKLLLETDCPYLAPVPFRGKRNEVSYLTYILTKLSLIFDLNDSQIIQKTAKNAETLFRLNIK